MEKSLVKAINTLEPIFSSKSDFELKEYSYFLKKRISENNSSDNTICESFALVRETSKRILGLRPFDTQLLGGIYLHKGNAIEMKTGEGKTLVGSLPAFLNSLEEKGVHIVTVNNYLAKRDYNFIGQIFRFLNVSVGLIQEDLTTKEKKANYNAMITYVTNSELAFDYLRDCTTQTIQDLTQRPFNYCIVDEVDSILIDEARTPLILSTNLETKTSREKFFVADSIVRCLKKSDYEIDEKIKNVILTNKGRLKVENLLEINDLYNLDNPWINYVDNALRAHYVYQRNIDYLTNDEKVYIIDEFTGRVLADRRWSDGLHQAVEVKENVPVSSNSETFASITYQNFFRLYPKLSGMTGTAKTEEPELQSIYNLSVKVIPTYKPMIRKDFSDQVYIDEYSKWKAVQKKCGDLYQKGIPVLVGTSTLSKSELLSTLLAEKNIPHELLNAKPENVKRESEIISQAGQRSSVTLATNMAGRGTDIVLGGNAEYLSKKKFLKTLIRAYSLKNNLIFSLHNNYFYFLIKFSLKVKISQLFFKLQKSQNFEKIQNSYSIYNIFLLENRIFEPKYNFLNLENYSLSYTRLNNETFPGVNFQVTKLCLLQNFYLCILNFHKQYVSIERSIIQNLGGLFVIGADRQDSRRIDNQLRGRAGRQGDPGSSQFFLSLDDRLFKLFADTNLKNLIKNLSLDAEDPIESSLVTKSLEKAQEKIESLNFSIRKQLFEYDEVLENQRAQIFFERRRILGTSKPKDWVIECCELVLDDICLDLYYSNQTNNKNQLRSKVLYLELIFQKHLNFSKELTSLRHLRKKLYKNFWLNYELKEQEYLLSTNTTLYKEIERLILIQSIDDSWKRHLQKMNLLKESVGWRVFAQKKSIREYKIGSFFLFKELLLEISYNVFSSILVIDNS